LQRFHLLFSASAKFFDDLEHTPETQHNDKGTDFLERSFQYDIYDESHQNDRSIEAMKTGTEEPARVNANSNYMDTVRTTYGHPKAQILANSSSMNRHEKIKLTIPRTSCAVAPSSAGTRPSQVTSWRIKSAKIELISRVTRARTL
jgi:hypothetical protein